MTKKATPAKKKQTAKGKPRAPSNEKKKPGKPLTVDEIESVSGGVMSGCHGTTIIKSPT